MKLYYSENLNPRVAVAVARYLDSPVDYVRASPRHPDHEEAFRPINPNTLVPVLVEDDGRRIWETDAVSFRLAQLAGSDFWPIDGRAAEVMMWVSWANHHLTRAGGVFYFERLVVPQIFARGPNEALLAETAPMFRKNVAILDGLLAGRAWLVGERPTYADFRVGTVLPFIEAAAMPLENCPNVLAWRARLEALDAWREPFAGLREAVAA